MKKEFIFIIFFFLLIMGIFFYKTFAYGYIPFPGDLLIAEYSPWKAYSYIGYTPGSYPNKAQYFDVLRQLYPWTTFSISAMKEGIVPLWNPYNFSGTPLLANFQSAVFYPFKTLYLLFPPLVGWTILVFLQPFLALLFTYFYARKIGISFFGSFFAAISYAFSSFMIVWLEYNTIGHVILWLPLILLSIEHLLQRKTAKWMFTFVFSLVAALFAGHPQIFGYLFVFCFAYVVYRSALQKKVILFFSTLFLLSLGISGIQLIPGIELISHAARSSHDYAMLTEKILIQPYQLIMLFVPDFFGNPATRNYWISDTYVGKVTSIGIIGLLFSILAIIKNKNGLPRFFSFSALLVLIGTTLNPLTLLFYKIEMPFFSSSSPTLGIFILCFSLSVLCGFGVDIWKKEFLVKKTYVVWTFSFLFLFLLLWLAVFLIPRTISADWTKNITIITTRTLLYITIVLVLGIVILFIGRINTKLKTICIILLFILHAFDLFRAFHKFNPFVSKQLVYPNAPILDFLKKEGGENRFWGYGSAAIESNFATQYSIFSPEGYDPLYPKQYGSFIQASENGKIIDMFTGRTRSDAFIAPGYGKKNLSENTKRLRVLDMLGVKYVLDRVENNSTEETFPGERFSPIYAANNWKIYENKYVAPRIFLTTDYRVFHTNQEFEKIFFAKDFNPSKSILLENKPQVAINKETLGGVKIVNYTPNKITLNTTTNGTMLLFVSDTYYPGWVASVDNKETNIYRANYAFRAVSVPKGQHTVVFTFDPLSFKIGLLATGVSFILLLLFTYLTHCHSRPDRESI